MDLEIEDRVLAVGLAIVRAAVLGQVLDEEVAAAKHVRVRACVY